MVITVSDSCAPQWPHRLDIDIQLYYRWKIYTAKIQPEEESPLARDREAERGTRIKFANKQFLNNLIHPDYRIMKIL